MSFQFVLKSVILNDLERRNSRYKFDHNVMAITPFKVILRLTILVQIESSYTTSY